MTRSLARIAQAVLYVAREVDHVLGTASIDNAREAVAEAKRRRAIRTVLNDLDRPERGPDEVVIPEMGAEGEFTDRSGEVQIPATLGV